MKKFVSKNVVAIVLVAAFVLVSFTNTTGKVNEQPNTTRVETVNTTYTDYKVLSYSSLSQLESIVKNFMGMGWQPVGGITVTSSSYMQPMAK